MIRAISVITSKIRALSQRRSNRFPQKWMEINLSSSFAVPLEDAFSIYNNRPKGAKKRRRECVKIRARRGLSAMEKGELERREKGLKLFGVRIMGEGGAGELELEEEEVMRKSSSMGNLASCTEGPAADHVGGEQGYLSDGGLQQNSRTRRRHERKRGIPWTEEEHRTFLAGLEKLGKGDWRGISRNFVTTRTPTQVASHAQKYFLRQSNPGKKKRRSSLFDMVINEEAAVPETASALSPKKPHEVKEETNNLSLDKHMMGAPAALVTTQVASPGFEASSVSPLKTSHGSITNFSGANLMVGISGSSAGEKVIPTLSFISPLNVPDQVATVSQASTTCAPNFLNLSLPHPPSPATSSLVESNDLELSIAPPRPHRLNKLGVAGAIRVV